METVVEAARVWDIDDLVERSDLVVDDGAFADLVAEEFDRSISSVTLGHVRDASGVAVPFDDESLADAWIERWDVADSCPHEPALGDMCIFHAHPDQKSHAEVKRAFLAAIDDPDRSRFVGARFGEFDLSTTVLAREFNHAIDLSYASFEALTLEEATIGTELDCSFATVTGSLNCKGVEIGGRASFLGLTAEGPALFTHATFRDRATFLKAFFGKASVFNYATFSRGTKFQRTRFDDSLEVRDADFEDVATFEWSSVAADADFRFTSFKGGARFRGASFGGDTDFHDARFERGALFENTEFADTAHFRHASFVTGTNYADATFEGDVAFHNATFGRRVTFADAVFEEAVRFRRANFQHIGRFERTRFAGEASFHRASFDELAEFTGVTFEDAATFTKSNVTELSFRDIESYQPLSFADAVLQDGAIRHEPETDTIYDLGGATVGDVRLEFAGRNPFDLVRFNETEFEGFQFADGAHRRYLKRNWRLHGTTAIEERIDNDTIENTYLKAKNGAADVGDNRAASEFFLKEMKYRRRASLDQFRDGSGIQRVTGVLKWLTSWFFNLTCGYGERPGNTVLSAVGTVVVFAFLFYSTGVALSSPSEYLLMSLQSFVALILGELPESGLLSLKVLSSIEAFVGAFFIGLFVFSLTRSIHR